MREDPETKDLKEAQRKREETESELARDSLDEQESAQHERRAEKARYLREKLEERAEAERRQDVPESGG
jgi:hypothetical protein